MLPLLFSLSLLSPGLAAVAPRPRSVITRGDGFVRASVNAVQHAPRLRARQNAVDLENMDSGTRYAIDVAVGTPPQTVSLIIDTGSPELWVNPRCDTANDAAACAAEPQYDPDGSSSLADTGVTNVITYGKGNVSIQYVFETISIGSATITEQVIGVGLDSYDIPMGILGLSPDTDGTADYPYVLDTMASQAVIASRAFSLDLRSVSDPSGAVIFGGVDTGKFSGTLQKLPILAPSQTPTGADRYWVSLTGVGMTQPDGSADRTPANAIDVPVFLDSGGTLSRLPTAIFQAIGNSFPGAQFDARSGFFVVPDCSALADSGGTVDFFFAGDVAVIRVPFAEFVWQPASAGNSAECLLGVLPDDDEPVLGDSFLRAAYVVFDQDNRALHIAQAASCGAENLVAIGKGVDAVPSATGLCEGAAQPTSAGDLDVAATQAPTRTFSGSAPAVTAPLGGPGPVKSMAKTTGTPNPTGLAAPKETADKKNAAVGGVSVGLGAGVALMVANIVAWTL
ncbi:aspartic peptidase domain-containing protein [Lasiosphaeria miniovina]|uniref:Aspartic peptidase domain-containing protein n=1 Tax=Lasiosphaeria miniovina TaxID=1954250 RepID=A0AA40AWT0_9PEZI|nr:aspartic peptidase domain-containing protein [Lasiosphaeria miniovina]KAK0723376.1 aspartic peptidase domain-containing protein [Lasiosphaeria miniovina]